MAPKFKKGDILCFQSSNFFYVVIKVCDTGLTHHRKFKYRLFSLLENKLQTDLALYCEADYDLYYRPNLAQKGNKNEV